MKRTLDCSLLFVSAAALFAAMICLTSTASAEHRVALLIGNSTYPKAPLVSPPHDIRAIGEALTKRGFVVTQAENLTGEQMRMAFEAFSRTVPTRGTALIYFSGYALAASKADDPNAENSLFPIDGNPHHQGTVFSSQTGTTRMFGRLATDSGSAANILIIDGCYAHPGQSADAPQGLVKSGKLPAESHFIHAAPWGQVSEPVTAGLSPLARKLSEELNSSKSLQAILKNLTPTQESTLGDLAHLELPAHERIASAAKLSAGTNAGEEWVNDLGMVFCWCPPGKFTMGSDVRSPYRESDETPVEVDISQGYWLSKYEFTRRELFTLTKGGIYLSTGDHKLQPLNKMRANDPEKFLAMLNEKVAPGWVYALPTEAEWEYAARAGTSTEYYFGNDPAELGNHGNFADRTLRESDSFGEVTKNWKADAKPFAGDRQSGLFTYAHKTWSDNQVTMTRVGSYPPNPWGLYDIHGNLAELTATPWHAERTPPAMFDDKVGWVSKGGSWLSTAQYCRCAFRGQFTFRARENSTENFLGLRFVLRRKETP